MFSALVDFYGISTLYPKQKRYEKARKLFWFLGIFFKHFTLLIRYDNDGRKKQRKEGLMDITSFYLRYYQNLLQYATAMTHNLALAEDLLQECFVRAIESPSFSILTEPQQKSWLYKSLRHLWIDQCRKAQTFQKNQEALYCQEEQEDDLSIVYVAQMLGRLSPAEQQLMTLRYFSGLSSREIGEILALPPATVRTRLRSTISKLKKWIQLEEK